MRTVHREALHRLTETGQRLLREALADEGSTVRITGLGTVERLGGVANGTFHLTLTSHVSRWEVNVTTACEPIRPLHTLEWRVRSLACALGHEVEMYFRTSAGDLLHFYTMPPHSGRATYHAPMPKVGRPPNPETRGKPVRLYLSAAALRVLSAVPDGKMSAYVSRLIVEDDGKSVEE